MAGGFLRMVRVPLVALLLLALPVSMYLLKIRAERESLKNRNFRLLAMISDQVRTKLNSYQSVISSAARETHPDFNFGRFLASQGLACDKPGCEQDPAPGDSVDATKIWRLEDGSGVVIEYKGAKSSIRRRIDVARRVLEPLAAETGDTFDDMVMADQADGRVIYQQSRSGLRFTTVDSLLPSSPAEKSAGKGNEKNEPAPLRFTTGLVEVEISGASYLVFQQPVQFSFIRGDRREPAEWLVCGIVRADRFLSDSMQVSYNWLILLTGLVLLPVLGWPIIKLSFMTHRERLTMRDVFLTGFSLLAAASLAVLLILHMYTAYRLERESDEQLRIVARDLQADLHGEISSMIFQLRTFNEALAAPDASPRPEVDYLRKSPGGLTYPYFDIAYWTDQQGRQIIKRMADSTFTPFIPITDRPIFRTFVGAGERWHLRGFDETHGFLLFATNTPTTGENQAVLAIENSGNAKAPYSFISNRPMTLFRPVMPPGFGFALVSRNGYVVFHSNASRNQQENFFDETDGSSAVRSAVLSGAGMFATAHYMGREHSMYVTPVTRLQNNQWSLVVFRDGTVTRTVELETVSDAAEALTAYLALVCLVAAAAYWRSRSAGLRSNLLPGGLSQEAYRRLCGLFLLLLLAWAALALAGPEEWLAAAALLVSGAAFGLVWLEVAGRMPDWGCVFGRLVPPAAGYVTFALALILLAGMLPAAALFRSARTLQHSLYVRWGQEKIAYQVEARLREGLKLVKKFGIQEPLRTQYASEFEPDRMKLGDFHRAFFNTQLGPLQKTETPGTESSSFNWLLSRMTPPVNKVAIELHAQRARNIENHGWRWDVGTESVTLNRQGPDKPSRFSVASRLPGEKPVDKVDLLARGCAMFALFAVGLGTVALLRQVVRLLFPPVYHPASSVPWGLGDWTGDVLALGP